MINFRVKQATTPISNNFIENYMPEVETPVFALIYIYALKCALSGEVTDNITIAEKFGLLESDVIKAWSYWQKKGLVKITKGENICIEFIEADNLNAYAMATAEPRQKSDYSPEEIKEITETTPEIKELLAITERIYGKTFSVTEINAIIDIYNEICLPLNVIAVLFQYCKSKPIKYVQATALGWKERGIDTYEIAMEYVENQSGNYSKVLNAFGITNRMAGDKEKEYIDTWVYTYRMPIDIITIACQRTIMRTGKVSFEYANKIIKNWYENSVTTKEQVEKYDQLHKEKAKKAKAEKATAGTQNYTNNSASKPKATKFNNYNQPTYTDDEYMAIIRGKRRLEANNE